MDFDKMNGLIPAIIQDATTNEVLMLGFMNLAAYEKTLKTNTVTFWSRSRNTLWTKGETSGNTLEVIEVFVDCDKDTLVIKARINGDRVCCHTGNRTCFYEKING